MAEGVRPIDTEIKVLKQEKDKYFQSIRGICIICVVLIHCMTGEIFKNSASFSYNYHYWLISRQFIDFAVPIFIFLTGYFTNIDKVKQDTKSYFMKRGARLLIPFFLWSVIFSLRGFAADDFKIDVWNTIIKIVTGQAATGYYFIVALIQLILLTPLIIKEINKKSYLINALIHVLLFYGLYYSNYIVNKASDGSVFAFIFPTWFIYYYIGIYLKANKRDHLFTVSNNKTKEMTIAILILFAAFLMSLIECYFLKSINMPDVMLVSQIKVSTILYSVSLINLIFVVKRHYNITSGNILSFIGDNAFGIFFIHTLWLGIVNKGMAYIPIVQNILPLYQLVQLLLTITLSLLSIWVTKKIIGNKKAGFLFGF
jgi:surface polysaccharide O-acyltransferase-like enzyme